MSVHLDGSPCKVRCPFCYLGARRDSELLSISRRPSDRGEPQPAAQHPIAQLVAAVEQLDYEELAIAVSEPVDEAAVLSLSAAAKARGRLVAITTTLEISVDYPSLLAHVGRLNLSVDAWKIEGDAAQMLAAVEHAARTARSTNPALEIIAIATLATPSFAELLVDGGLLVALNESQYLDGVALSALKPPPPFCDRAFWLRTMSTLRPLLDRALDKRLFLDCYVAARLLGLGGCPGRADLSPTANGRIAFRSCVYAQTPDLEVATAKDVPAAYVAPTECPFDTRLA